jgi:hypothetical protein
MISSLVLVGYPLQYHYHYTASAFAWAMHSSGVLISSTAIIAYLLQVYADRAGDLEPYLVHF